MDREIEERAVQLLYMRYEEYLSFGELEADSILLASQDVKRWILNNKLGELTEEQTVSVETALINTGLYVPF